MRRLTLLLAVAAYSASGVTQIGPGERGVAVRLGRVVATPEPGLYWGAPWGFGSVQAVPTAEVRQAQLGLDEPGGVVLLTGDENLLTARLTVEYAVGPTDADLIDFYLMQDEVPRRLEAQLAALAGEWARGQPIDSALLEGRLGLARFLARSLPAWAGQERLGVTISRVTVDSLAPPGEVREAFDAVAQAQNRAEQAVTEAQKQASTRQSEARAGADRARALAAGYAATEPARAQAEAAAFAARRAALATPESRALLWQAEMTRVLEPLAREGRVRPLDHLLGPGGVDLHEAVRPPSPLRK